MFALEKVIKELEINNIKLIIIGLDCGEAGNIKKIIATRGLEGKVIVIGAVAYERVKDFLAIADIFVLPSLYEGLPLPLLEAMASGKAVIFSDLSSARQVIKEGVQGVLVKPADPDSLAKAIARLSLDNKMKKSLGNNAKKIAAGFDSFFEARRLKEVYAQARESM